MKFDDNKERKSRASNNLVQYMILDYPILRPVLTQNPNPLKFLAPIRDGSYVVVVSCSSCSGCRSLRTPQSLSNTFSTSILNLRIYPR